MNRGKAPSLRIAAAAALAVSICALFACSGPAPRPVPPAKEKAGAWNRRGLAAEARGDRDGALAAFRESLTVNRSIEDVEGTAVALLNLSRVHRLEKERDAAMEHIDAALRLVPPGNPLFPEAAFEKGKNELAAGNLPGAEEWARKAVESSPGPSSGRMLNLLARALFLEGKAVEARRLAESALEANRAAGASSEEANSLRLLGDLAAAGADRGSAEGLYLRALSIDKEIAESAKISTDLKSLGAAAAARGDTERALSYYGRAAEVSRNGGDPQGAEEALKEMERLRAKDR